MDHHVLFLMGLLSIQTRLSIFMGIQWHMDVKRTLKSGALGKQNVLAENGPIYLYVLVNSTEMLILSDIKIILYKNLGIVFINI